MSEMTIAQGLRRIKKLKGELAEYKKRIEASVSHIANREPAFRFSESIENFKKTQSELLSLESALAVTNALTSVKFDGKDITLSEACRRLQELKGEIAFIEALPVRDHDKSNEESWEYNDEMKRIRVTNEWRCALPKPEQAKLVAKLKDDFDRLNDAVETMNHRTALKRA